MRQTGVISTSSVSWVSTSLADGWYLWMRYEPEFYFEGTACVAVNKDPVTPLNGHGQWCHWETKSVYPMTFLLSGGYVLSLWVKDETARADILKSELLMEIEAIERAMK